MRPPDRVFTAVWATPLIAALALAIVAFRLSSFIASDVGHAGQTALHWCRELADGLLAQDDILFFILMGLLPVSFGLGATSMYRQWRLTRRFMLVRTAGRPFASPPHRVLTIATRLGLTGRVDLVVDTVPDCFCHGLARPRVCLTTGLLALLTDGELEAVLLHEQYHVMKKDPLRAVITRALAWAFFFVPAVAELGRFHRIMREIAADDYVIQAQGSPAKLSSALLKAIATPFGAELAPIPHLAGHNTQDSSELKVRIDHLLDQKVWPNFRPAWPGIAGTGLFVLLTAVAALAPERFLFAYHEHVVDAVTIAACSL